MKKSTRVGSAVAGSNEDVEVRAGALLGVGFIVTFVAVIGASMTYIGEAIQSVDLTDQQIIDVVTML